jgi:hypothetical protein
MPRLSDQISKELDEPETKTESTTDKVEVPPAKPAATESDSKAIETPPKTAEPGEGGEKGDSSQEKTETTAKTADSTPKTEEKASTPLKFKLKVDGEDIELGQDETISYAQKGISADERFRQAAQMKKDAQQVLSYIESEPFNMLEQVFSQKYGDRGEEMLRRAAIDYLTPYAQRAQMTPEQQAEFDSRQKFEREKKEFEGRRAKAQQEEESRIAEEAGQRVIAEVANAFKKVGLEDNPLNVRKVARMLSEAIEYEIPMTAEEAVTRVKREGSTAPSTKPLSIDELLANPETAAQIRNKLVEAAKPPSTPPFPATPQGAEKEGTKERAPRKSPIHTMRDFHRLVTDAAEHG